MVVIQGINGKVSGSFNLPSVYDRSRQTGRRLKYMSRKLWLLSSGTRICKNINNLLFGCSFHSFSVLAPVEVQSEPANQSQPIRASQSEPANQSQLRIPALKGQCEWGYCISPQLSLLALYLYFIPKKKKKKKNKI